MAGLERLSDRELGGMEALFVKGDGEVASRSTVMSLFTLDRAPDFEEVVRAHDRASRLAVRFRQRVVAPVVPVSRPYWIVDPDFDIRYHVRLAPLPGGGTYRELFDFAERLGQVPVDPARPLWEVILITGLDDGSAGLLYKFHHAISDGGGGVTLFSSIFSSAPDASTPEMPPKPAVEDVTATELTRQRLGELPLQAAGVAIDAVIGVAGVGKRLVLGPRSALSNVVGYAGSLRRTMTESPADPSPLFARRGLRRYYGAVQGSTADLKAGAKRLNCSLNDAYIAALSGGIGRYHQGRGAAVDAIPLAMPVSTRRPDDPVDTNRFVGVRIAAPISEPDLAERARLVGERVQRAREEPALEALSSIAPVAGLLPMWLITSLAGSQHSDVQASNIASWPDPQYLGRAKVLGTLTFGPLAMSAMMVVLITYGGHFDVGFNIDTESIDDPAELVRLVGEEFQTLVGPGHVDVFE